MALRIDSGDDLAETHEINVTPFIDVMLVLLIIFMVAAPLSTVQLPVDLPAASAAAQPQPEEPITITLQADSRLMLGEAAVELDTLDRALDGLTGADKTRRVFVRADKRAAYGDVMEVLNVLRVAGYTQISLVALQQQS